MEDKDIEAQTIMEEAIENLEVESTPENISSKRNLYEFQVEGAKPIDPTLIIFLDNVDKILKKDTFFCNSCGADDWFDCGCSDYESKSEKKITKGKKKFVKTSREIDTNGNTPETEMGKIWPCKKAYVSFADDTFIDEIKDLAAETKSGQKEIEVKPKPRNYTCNFDECKSLFVTKKGLKRHSNSIHLNLRPFNCSKCSLSFNRKHHLQYHMNSVHLKLKPHECGQCSAKFSRKEHLKKHINDVHLNLKPFKCSHCSTAFNRNSNMKSHFKRIHGK